MDFRPVPALFYLKERQLGNAVIEFLRLLSLKIGPNVFGSDNLIVFFRNMGFITDSEFRAPFDAHAEDSTDLSIIWRSHVLTWAARSCLAVEGDFVECGTYRGFSARVVYDYAQLAKSKKTFYLYDLFDLKEGPGVGHAMDAHGPDLAAKVAAGFGHVRNVKIVVGRVPESLGIESPEKIAFLHIDMNNAEAELGALNVLWDRVSEGGIVVFDDYGWSAYRAQKLVIDEFLVSRDHRAVELPTGQALVIKRGAQR